MLQVLILLVLLLFKNIWIEPLEAKQIFCFPIIIEAFNFNIRLLTLSSKTFVHAQLKKKKRRIVGTLKNYLKMLLSLAITVISINLLYYF